MPTTDAPTPAWTTGELADPHAHARKPDKVRAMFEAIAQSYDLNNRVHSLGRDRAWRRFAARRATDQASGPIDVLDVACGTGDLTHALAHAGCASVVGLDFTPGMLEIARRKQARLGDSLRPRVRYLEGDAQALPFPDASFDAVTIAFGIRNVADPARALGEFARVLRPGGRLVVLEFGRPRFWPLRAFNAAYCGWIMPRSASLIARDRSGAYRYLPRSVATFMDRAAFEAELARAGLASVESTSLTFGICVCYRGWKR